MTDEDFMRRALKLARKGQGYTSPNPMVGALVVKNGRIIGEGYHRRCGTAHAEVNAIRNAGPEAQDATLYVTLEPCCHHGKTPPCTDFIVQNKIARVVIGTMDVNPLVACRGIEALRTNGITVEVGVLEKECQALNEVFFHYMKTGLPFVTLKYAQTLDGRIATVSGQSRWISSEESLNFAHKLRAQHDAILVGINTVMADNPELTVRRARGRNPLRVVVDSHLKIPSTAKVLQNLDRAKTLIATTRKKNDKKFQRLTASGATVVACRADRNGKVSLKDLFHKLAARGISSVLIEGGSQIITTTVKENLAQRLVVTVAPKILGKGLPAVGDLNIRRLTQAKPIFVKKVRQNGTDLIIDARFDS